MKLHGLFILVTLVAIGPAQGFSPPEKDLTPADYWVSRDQTEVILAFPTRRQIWYFNNNSEKLCFTFKVPGDWKPGNTSGLMLSEEYQGIAGVLVLSEQELQYSKGDDLLARAVHFITKINQRAAGMDKPPDSSEVSPFQSSRAGSIKWTANWIAEREGKKIRIEINKVFVEIAPGWVAQITVSATERSSPLLDSGEDEIAREILQTLENTSDPGCYWPFIRKFVPPLRADARQVESYRLYPSSRYPWSISYPFSWIINDKDPAFVRFFSKRERMLCGIHSTSARSSNVDDFTDFMLAGGEQVARKQLGLESVTLSRTRISLPNENVGNDVLVDLRPGGRSRRIFAIIADYAYLIDCETYVHNWGNAEPIFDRIIRSFTVPHSG